MIITAAALLLYISTEFRNFGDTIHAKNICKNISFRRNKNCEMKSLLILLFAAITTRISASSIDRKPPKPPKIIKDIQHGWIGREIASLKTINKSAISIELDDIEKSAEMKHLSLENKRGLCFFNAALQTLHETPSILRYFLIDFPDILVKLSSTIPLVQQLVKIVESVNIDEEHRKKHQQILQQEIPSEHLHAAKLLNFGVQLHKVMENSFGNYNGDLAYHLWTVLNGTNHTGSIRGYWAGGGCEHLALVHIAKAVENIYAYLYGSGDQFAQSYPLAIADKEDPASNITEDPVEWQLFLHQFSKSPARCFCVETHGLFEGADETINRFISNVNQSELELQAFMIAMGRGNEGHSVTVVRRRGSVGERWVLLDDSSPPIRRNTVQELRHKLCENRVKFRGLPFNVASLILKKTEHYDARKYTANPTKSPTKTPTNSPMRNPTR